ARARDALAAVQSLGGCEAPAPEGNRPIVVGEGELGPVRAYEAPAPAKGRHPARDMGGETVGKRPHSLTSTSGIAGTRAASKPAVSMSSRSVSKRTGTSNRNPADTATPASGAAEKVTIPVSASTAKSWVSIPPSAARTLPATGLVIGRT